MNSTEKKELKQHFVEKIKSVDALNKKYKYLAPVIVRYLDTIIEEFPDVSMQSIDNILNMKVKTVLGDKINFSANGYEYELPNGFDNDSNFFYSIKLFTHNEQRENLTHCIDRVEASNELASNIEKGDSKFAIYKRQWKYIKTSIHETSHVGCYHKLKQEPFNEITKTRNITSYNGGIPIKTYVVDKDGNLITLNFLKEANLLHEGVTEMVAQKIFRSSNFDDFIINGEEKNNRKYQYISYMPVYYIASIYNLNNHNLLSNAYFSDKLSEREQRKIEEIVDDFKPTASSIFELKKLDSVSMYKDLQIELSARNLAISIDDFLSNQKNELFKNMDENFKINTMKKFAFYQNLLLKPVVWYGFLKRNSNLKNETFETFFEQFSNVLVDVQEKHFKNDEELKKYYFLSKI